MDSYHKVFVSFPRNGSEYSTRTCFRSLGKQFKDTSLRVVGVKLEENDKLILSIDKSSSLVGDNNITRIGSSFNLDLIGLTAADFYKVEATLSKAIIDERNNKAGKDFELSIKELKGTLLTFELKESSMIRKAFEIPNVSPPASNSYSPHQEVETANAKTPSMLPSSLLLIDGSNLIARCYHATAYKKEEHQLLRSSKGVYTNAIKTMVEKLLIMLRILQPGSIAILWDVPRSETFRRKAYDGYKASRDKKEKPVSLDQQFVTAKALFSSMGIAQFTIDEMEADDLAGAFSKRWAKEMKKTVYIWSNDKDLFQLLDENIIQLVNDEPFRVSDFEKKYGMNVSQWVDWKAMTGDAGDDIMGIPGIGGKSLPLLLKYVSLEGIYDALENGGIDPEFKRYVHKLEEGKQSGLLSKYLATIKTDIPEVNQIQWEDLKTNINRKGYLEQMEELEIRVPSTVA